MEELYPHLRPAIRQAMTLSNEERCNLIRKGCWIGHPVATDIVNQIVTLMNWPRMERMPSLLVFGPSGTGKTKIIARAREVLPKPLQLDGVTLHPVVAIQLQPGPGLAGVYKEILRSLGVPFPSRADVDFLQARAIEVLARVQCRLLIIDEVHHILTAAPLAQRQVLAQLKHISNKLELPLVAAGTEDAWYALKTDLQLASRFDAYPLPIWEEGKDFLQLLMSFGALIPLRESSNLATVDMARTILGRADGRIGEITKLLQAAAILAIETGTERITADLLARARYQSPREKQHAGGAYAA